MGQIEKAISYSKKIESLLVNKLGAQGRGLHEKVSSVETQLPREMVRSIRFIATLRNKLVHEEGFRIDDMSNFVAKSKLIITALRKHRGASFNRRVFPLKHKGVNEIQFKSPATELTEPIPRLAKILHAYRLIVALLGFGVGAYWGHLYSGNTGVLGFGAGAALILFFLCTEKLVYFGLKLIKNLAILLLCGALIAAVVKVMIHFLNSILE